MILRSNVTLDSWGKSMGVRQICKVTNCDTITFLVNFTGADSTDSHLYCSILCCFIKLLITLLNMLLQWKLKELVKVSDLIFICLESCPLSLSSLAICLLALLVPPPLLPLPLFPQHHGFDSIMKLGQSMGYDVFCQFCFWLSVTSGNLKLTMYQLPQLWHSQ